MPWTPAQKIFAGAVAVFGAGYLMFRKRKPSARPKPQGPRVDQVPTVPKPEPKPPRPVPDPLPIPDSEGTPGIPEPPIPPGEPTPPPPTPTPGMEGPGGLAPQESENIPPQQWERRFNENIESAIYEGRARVETRTGEDLEAYAVARVFPEYTWPVGPDGPEWKKTVVSTTRGILFDLADVDSWPFSGTRETIDAAKTFWVSAAKSLEACRNGGATTRDELRLCAAQATFSGSSWPATPSSRPWEREAWSRFEKMVPSGPSAVGGLTGTEFNWRVYVDAKFSGAVSSGLADQSLKTAEDLALFVCSSIFGDKTWPPSAGSDSWQYDVWNEVLRRLAERAGAYSFGAHGDSNAILNGITFWISGERNLRSCLGGLQFGKQTEPSEMEILTCAGRRTFPKASWPPVANAPGWQWHAWQKFKLLLSDMM